jgi:hypothetical protein
MGGASIGAGIMGAGFGFGAAFLALGVGGDFFGATFTTFFATFLATLALALTVFFALAFPFAFTFMGRVFFFATDFFTAARLAFAGRFLDLLFFAMVNLLLEIVRTLCESSPEKVRCHLCMVLESVT